MNDNDGWIVIPNWDRFQHYKKRNPAWIKVYTDLLDNPDYLGLTMHQSGVLHRLWLEYARARCQVVDSTATVSRQLGGRTSRATLIALNHAGFIEFSASRPLASRALARERELLRNSLKSGSPPASGSGGARPQNEDPEPDRDPEAVAKIQALVHEVFDRDT